MEQIPAKDDLKHPLKNLPLIKSDNTEPQFEQIDIEKAPALKEITMFLKNRVYEWDIETDPKKKVDF